MLLTCKMIPKYRICEEKIPRTQNNNDFIIHRVMFTCLFEGATSNREELDYKIRHDAPRRESLSLLSYQNTMSVNATKGKPSTHQAHYNHCTFRHQFGRRFLSISLQVFQSQGTSQSSWWLWTDYRSMLIFAPYPTRLHQLWSLNLSWI